MTLPSKEFLEIFRNTNGALSVSEAIAIMNLSSQAPEGLWLEMGTFKGKSAMAAIYGGNPKEFILIEPMFGQEVDCNELANRVSEATGKGVKLVFIKGYSTDYLRATSDMYSFVFSDAGSHQDGLPMEEVKLLEDKMLQGGVIAFHDWDSQFKEVKEASDYLVGTGKYEYISINWNDITTYVNENDLEANNQSWHHTEMKTPCFVGAVRRK